jgi:hypothetical protein
MRGAQLIVLTLVAVAGVACGSARRDPVPAISAPVAVITGPCPAPPDSASTARLATVYLDGRRIAVNVPARLESEAPESYQLDAPEPPELAKVPIDSIDLVEFVRGPEAERLHGLCPGVVGFLITTKRPPDPR